MASVQHRVLEALVTAGRPAAADSLAVEDSGGVVRVSQSLARLVRCGLAHRTGRGVFAATPNGIALVANGGRQSKPRGVSPHGLLDRTWKLLRLDRVVTTAAILTLCCRPGQDAGRQRAYLHWYLRQLVRADYIREEGAVRRGDQRVWRLLRDTGPQPPSVYRPKSRGEDTPDGLWDPNLDEYVPWTR